MITTLLGIWLTARRRLISFPVTLISDFVYLLVFFRAALFSDALLQLFFLAFTLYGWWYWWRGVREDGEVRVAPQSRQNLVISVVVGIVGSIVWGLLMRRLNAALPFLDATLMIFSLVASWWSVRRHISNWWLWIVVDLIYIGEYIYKGLLPTAALYLGLVFLAVIGLRSWNRAASTQQEACLVS